jgi:hypothetical protein
MFANGTGIKSFRHVSIFLDGNRKSEDTRKEKIYLIRRTKDV